MLRTNIKKTTHFLKKYKKEIGFSLLAFAFVFFGAIALWISTFRMPDLASFDTRKIIQSTKIYDRTGKILLYDVHDSARRTEVPFEEISKDLKNATVAIEDSTFYENSGIKITSIIRSLFANILFYN